MQKIFSVFLATCFTFLAIMPSADASVRIRRGRVVPVNSVYKPYVGHYQNPQVYQAPQYYQAPVVTQNTSTSTYYFSPTYLQGYTYYSTPFPGYYLYSTTPVPSTANIQEGKFYFSPVFIQGYTYYATPTSGYYYYLGTAPINTPNYVTTVPPVNNYYSYTNPYIQPYQYTNNNNSICTIVNGVYQCVVNNYAPTYATYPGCSAPDIIIGTQIWASCNALDRNAGSTSKTGWFFAGDRESSFTSNNGTNTALEWMGKQTRESSWNIGPCASGYRLPNRGEWETLQSYARAGNTTVSSLISLGQNGSYQGSRNTNGDIVITGRLSANAAYWSSSVDGGVPIVMHVGSTYQGYNTTGTDYGYVNNAYQWTYTDTGLELLRSTTGELANVRCIRQ